MKLRLLPISLFFTSGLFYSSGVSAAPLVSLGDSVDIYFKGSTSLQWSSNIFRDEDVEVDDLIWTLTPGFEVNVGRGLSNADLSIITSYSIRRYDENDQLDSEQLSIRAAGSYQTSRLDLSGSVGYVESDANSGTVQLDDELIRTETVSANLNGEYRLSPKFSLGSGISYTDKSYEAKDDRFSDEETIRVPLDVFYELTPKVDLSVGYSYSSSDVDDGYFPSAILGQDILTKGYNTESHFFNVGMRGNLLPKLTGFFKVGYRTRNPDDRVAITDPSGAVGAPIVTARSQDDSGTLGLSSSLNWATTPKLSTTLALSRNFGFGGEGQSTVNTSTDLIANYSISSHYSASANFGYTHRDYSDQDRVDDQYRVGVSLSYSPNQYWSFSTGYRYANNDSDLEDASYKNHTFDISASLRY